MSVSCYLFAFLRETWILMKENLHELPRAVHKWCQLFYLTVWPLPEVILFYTVESIDWTIHGFGFLLVANYKFYLVKAKCSKDGMIGISSSHQKECILFAASAYSIFGIFCFDQLKICSWLQAKSLMESFVHLLFSSHSVQSLLGMPIPRWFSFLGDSGNRGMAICHSSGIGETKTYSPGFGSGVGEISGSILFQIWSQFEISFYWKEFFLEFFFEIKRIWFSWLEMTK